MRPRVLAEIRLVCERCGVRLRSTTVRAWTGTGVAVAAIGWWIPSTEASSADESGTAAIHAAAVAGEPPAELSDAQFELVPQRSFSYTSSRATARAASVRACRLYAFDPYTRAPSGKQKTRVVIASGWQACALGLGQRTQSCLYKRHTFLFFDRWKRNRCGPETFDRRPTFRPVGTAKFCVPKGAGRWRTVIFGSIYYNGPQGPGRYYGAVRSYDKTFENCN